MFNRKELKERAKLVLLRSYSKIFLACLAVNIISGGGLNFSTRKLKTEDILAMPPQKMFMAFLIFVALAFIAVALTIFVVSPLRVGLKRFMIENAENDARLDLLFAPFNDGYKNIVKVQFIKGLFITLWSIPAYLPTVAVGLLADKILPMYEGVKAGSVLAMAGFTGVVTLWLVLTLLLAVPSIIKRLQYILVPYMLAENPELDWKTALLRSKEMMVGNKWPYVKLILSFALWYLAASLLCCIGGFLVLPYIEATVCEMYLELSGKSKANIEADIEF